MAALPSHIVWFSVPGAMTACCALRWLHHFSAGFWSGTYTRGRSRTSTLAAAAPASFIILPCRFGAGSLFAPLVGLAGTEAVDWRALSWASSLGLVLSGQTAYGCFRAFSSPTRAFVGAVLYMIAPYHLAIDLLERAAYAEFWAFVWMPLALGGVIRLMKNEPWAWEKTTCGLALLYMTHLPGTLVFMPFVLLFACAQGNPYALLEPALLWRRSAGWRRCSWCRRSRRRGLRSCGAIPFPLRTDVLFSQHGSPNAALLEWRTSTCGWSRFSAFWPRSGSSTMRWPWRSE